MNSPRSLALMLTLALAGASPALAQDDAPRAQDAIEGRNSWLRRALTKVNTQSSEHVLVLTGCGYGVSVPGGYVLTSNWILPRNGRTVTGVDSKGGQHVLLIHSRNLQHGVALLRFEQPKGAPKPIAFGASKSLKVGQFVMVGSNEPAPISVGVVSAINRPVDKAERGPSGNMLQQLFSDGSNQGHKRAYPRVVQHDAPLEAEHFGAPLLDTSGRLIGINVAYPFRGSSHAVGIDEIRAVMQDLVKGGVQGSAPAAPETPAKPTPRDGDDDQRPWLGASVASATPAQLGKGHAFGLVVKAAQGPAAKAGLQKGDVIVKLDGKPFPGIDAFAARLNAKSPGDEASLTVLRGAAGIEIEVEVTLGTRK